MNITTRGGTNVNYILPTLPLKYVVSQSIYFYFPGLHVIARTLFNSLR
jgi:hypothetical protein